MRPTKLTENVLTAVRTVIEEWHNALVCSDEELCFLANERLEPHERISYRSFQRYKRLVRQHCHESEYADHLEPEEATPEKLELYQALHQQFTRTNIKVKNYCMDKMIQGLRDQGHFKWLLQMRLRHWNGMGETNAAAPKGRQFTIPRKIVPVSA